MKLLDIKTRQFLIAVQQKHTSTAWEFSYKISIDAFLILAASIHHHNYGWTLWIMVKREMYENLGGDYNI